LDLSKNLLVDGKTPLEIDIEVEKFILSKDAKPSFKGLNGYPYSTCISINEQVVHSPPVSRKIQYNDIVKIDIGVSFCGHCTDAARTLLCGDDKERYRLVETAYDSLNAGIEKCKENNTIGDVSFSIQRVLELSGYRTPIEIGGHGIGFDPHTEPFIPNYGVPNSGSKLIYGMCLAVEPVVIEKDNKLTLGSDGWTLYSQDGHLSAHVEDTIVVTDTAPLILTRRTLDGTQV
jgi:methionyl aminopeptidase